MKKSTPFDNTPPFTISFLAVVALACFAMACMVLVVFLGRPEIIDAVGGLAERIGWLSPNTK